MRGVLHLCHAQKISVMPKIHLSPHHPLEKRCAPYYNKPEDWYRIHWKGSPACLQEEFLISSIMRRKRRVIVNE